MVGNATFTIVMSMMFMNIADTKTVPTATFWLMLGAGTIFLNDGEADVRRRHPSHAVRTTLMAASNVTGRMSRPMPERSSECVHSGGVYRATLSEENSKLLTQTIPKGSAWRSVSAPLRTAWLTAAVSLSLVVGLSLTPGAAAGASSKKSATAWLCNPNKANDPCALSRKATSVPASGTATTVKPSTASTASKFDCFYVYPTVSPEAGANANLIVQPAEIAAAQSQASRFSQVCRVWAPMYRQRTLASLLDGGLGSDKKADQVAYKSVLSAWKDYLAHDNDGRPIVFIGHSQGAAILINLLQSQVDPSALLRKQMVSAIILGGNVQVPTGKTVGGSFKHLPVCTSAVQNGCVIAYSSFATTPPSHTLFGRPGQGVSLQSQQKKSQGQRVACVNPVNFSSSSASSLPYFLAATSKVPGLKVSTKWVTYPSRYTVTCAHSGNATWLQVTPTATTDDRRPVVQATVGPTWGLHLYDVNLTLGNLVLDVAYEEAAHK
jgi:hypothetical protein